VKELTTKGAYLTHTEMLEELSKPEWFDDDEELE
jgi:hypothetical protein